MRGEDYAAGGERRGTLHRDWCSLAQTDIVHTIPEAGSLISERPPSEQRHVKEATGDESRQRGARRGG